MLDTGAAASLITESICRSSSIPILPATQQASWWRIIFTDYWRNKYIFKL